MKATINILCMFICMYDVLYIETQSFNPSQLHKFMRNVPNNHKTVQKVFFRKINKNMQGQPGLNYFVHLWV